MIFRFRNAILFAAVFLWFNGFSSVSGITPGEVFEQGRRAFHLGHWLEAKECFLKFSESWPTHQLAPHALYYRSMAEARLEPSIPEEQAKQTIASLSAIIKALGERLPEADLLELKAQLEHHQKKSGLTVGTPTASLDLPPDQLTHALNRGWIPFEKQDPISTLAWIKSWLERHDKNSLPPLVSRLQLLRAKALWQLRLSPLPTEAFLTTLRSWGDWPVQNALDRSLKAAFENGDLDTKREAALLGVSSDFLRFQNTSKHKDTLWVRYLRERGINFSEAWCPR